MAKERYKDKLAVYAVTIEEAMKAQELILTGQATEAQIACFLTALRMKGETLVSDFQNLR